MKLKSLLSLTILTVGTSAFAYEGPSPLTNVKIEFSSSFSSSTKLYVFNYKITNPKANDGQIIKIDISLPRDPEREILSASEGLTHCSHYHRRTSENIFSQSTIVAVGSSAPENWSCGYSMRNGGGYGWGSSDAPYRIKPGASMGGFSLNSFSLPGIRNVVIEPNIAIDELPEQYNNPDLMAALEEKVKWSGKTVGPKAPPKIFVAAEFLDYLVSLKDQSVTLGWISGKDLEKDLDGIFKRAKKNLDPCDHKELKKEINLLIGQMEEKKQKGLSSEARALLEYNGKYFLSQLPQLTKAEEKKCHGSHEHHHHHGEDNHGHEDHEHHKDKNH